MAELSYATLPKAEKKRIACELRPMHTLDEMEPWFGVNRKTLWQWTKHLGVDFRKIRIPKQVKLDEDFCHCETPARDSFADSFCKRGATCIYCTKPRRA